MDKDYFIKLLQKYLKGDATKEERQFIESYCNLFQMEPDVLESLNLQEKEKIAKEIENVTWDNISRSERSDQKINFLNRKILKVATAAAILTVMITGSFYLFKPSSKKQFHVTPVIAIQHKENRVIFLPDGSTVILSTGSNLNYPSSFDELKKREVFLEGQAFFDIKHNASRPFIVHTGKLETTVLGTAFNIKAMPGEMDITVTVKRGKVTVSDQNKILGTITPNQQITYDKKKVSSVIKIVESDSYLEWKEQDLLFDNLTIGEAAKILEDQYKIKIRIDDQSISSQRFTATFSKSGSFDQAINSICLFNGLSYKYNEEKSAVIISDEGH